jgi:hypothetical protein
LIVYDLNGKECKWNLVGYQAALGDSRPRSDLHLQVRKLIKQVWPVLPLLEEVPIPKYRLFADFFVPGIKVMVEAHGRQHYEFIKHFHGNVKNFLESKKRDQLKQQWCEHNKINLIICAYNEEEYEWRRRLEQAIS